MLDTIQAIIVCLAKQFGIQTALVYGSMARGNYKRNSDVDMMVFFKKIPSTELLYDLHRQLCQRLQRAVDLVVMKVEKHYVEVRDGDLDFYDNVQREKVVVYGQDIPELLMFASKWGAIK